MSSSLPEKPEATAGLGRAPGPRRWRRAGGLGLGLVALMLLAALLLDRCFPLPRLDVDRTATVVLARDGSPLRAFADDTGVWRYATDPAQVSPLYFAALLGYEDRWFYRHPGVNPYALARGLWGAIRHGHIVSGGSTLTMQVARIITPIPHSWLGKCVQILRALQLEVHLDKAQILELYLDYAPFGGPIQGVEAASWAYLGKSAAHLSRAEAALLAVLPQAPSLLRPDRHPEAARRARNKLLERMRGERIWSSEEVSDAELEPVVARSLRAPLLAALLAQRLHQQAPHAKQIATTIDANLQRAVEDRVSAYLGRLPPRTSIAVLAVDNASLQARVYVGTGEFANPQRLGHIDMVVAERSPGSTLKPFLYGLALDDGLLTSQSLLVDAPQDFGGYQPANFDEQFNGPVSVAEALQRSLNVPAVQVLDQLGPSRFAARLAHGGIQLQLPAGASPNLSIILGGAATNLESLVGAYTALANAGVSGRVVYSPQQPLHRARLLSPGAAWIVRRILQDNPATNEGLANAQLDSSRDPLAWKTGTSYGYRDAWAIGVNNRWSIGVWIGRPDGSPSPGQYGAVTSLPLLQELARLLPAAAAGADWRQPASVQALDICWPLGSAASATAPALCRQRRSAWELDGNLPPTLAEHGQSAWTGGALQLRVDRDGRRLSGDCHAKGEQLLSLARWPAVLSPWLSAQDAAAAALPPLAPNCAPDAVAASSDLQIAGIYDGARIRDVSAGKTPVRLTLHALGASGTVQWLLDGRLQGHSQNDAGMTIAVPTSGPHQVTALAASGAFARVSLQVQSW